MTLSTEDRTLYRACCECQLTRSIAIQILHHHHRYVENGGAAGINADSIVPGAFVRALDAVSSLEEKKYLVAQVEGVVEGEPYAGFSANPHLVTRWYLRLRLPPKIQENDDEESSCDDLDHQSSDYDLTSISNSTMTEEEFGEWLRGVRSNVYPGPEPSIPLLKFMSGRLQPFQRSKHAHGSTTGSVPPPMTGREDLASPQMFQSNMSRSHHEVRSDSGSMSNNSPIPGNRIAAFREDGNEQQPGGNSPPPRRMGSEALDPLSPTSAASGRHAVIPQDARELGSAPVHNLIRRRTQMEELARRECIHELSEQGSVFPQVYDSYRASRLRLIERDLMDYLQLVRDSIQEKRETCVICFDMPPTVVLYPCKHRVICRNCAASGCDSCPVCRSSFHDMFEVEEL